MRLTKMNITSTILICLALFYTIMYSNNTIFASSVYLSPLLFVCSIAILIINFKEISKKFPIELIFLLIIVINLVLGVVYANNSIGRLMIMVSLISTIIYSKQIKLSDKSVKILSLLMVILTVLGIIEGQNYVYNKNTIGYLGFMLVIFSMIFIESLNIKNRNKIIFNILIVITSLIVVYLSDCRSTLYAEIFFLIIIHLPLKSKNLAKWIGIITFISIIIFVFIYVSLWNNSIDFKLPFTEKDLYTGREAIWSEVLENLNSNIFFGIGSNYSLNTIDSLNLHNSLLDILSVYGISVFMIFVVYMFNFISKAAQNIDKGKINKISYWALISMFIIAYAEINLVWNKETIFLILLMIFIFHNQSKNIKNKEG